MGLILHCKGHQQRKSCYGNVRQEPCSSLPALLQQCLVEIQLALGGVSDEQGFRSPLPLAARFCPLRAPLAPSFYKVALPSSSSTTHYLACALWRCPSRFHMPGLCVVWLVPIKLSTTHCPLQNDILSQRPPRIMWHCTITVPPPAALCRVAVSHRLSITHYPNHARVPRETSTTHDPLQCAIPQQEFSCPLAYASRYCQS